MPERRTENADVFIITVDYGTDHVEVDDLIVKRFEIAGRKVILYIEDMMLGETGSFEIQARAKYPVRAKEVVSQVYSCYYRPEYRGETMGGEMTVTE
jgi:CD109 antigen